MTTANFVQTSNLDPHEQEFSELAWDVLTNTRLLDKALRPVNRPEDHPLVIVARLAHDAHEDRVVREYLLRQLAEEVQGAPDRRIAQGKVNKIIAVYDAAISGDPIALREAMQVAARAGSPSEWTEAV